MVAGGDARRVLSAHPAGPPRAREQRDLPPPLARHLGDPAGDDLGLPRGEGLRDGGLRDLPFPPRRFPPVPREHADHARHRRPAAADGGGGRRRPGGRPLLRQLRDLQPPADSRRLHVLPGRPLRHVHADQAALPPQRDGAGRAGRRRTHLRGPGHPPRGAGGLGRAAAGPLRGRDRVSRRRLPLRRRAGHGRAAPRRR